MEFEFIRLEDKDQKRLFCAAWHLKNFIENIKDEIVGEFSGACEKCKYQEECLKNENNDIWENIGILTELTGVRFNALRNKSELEVKSIAIDLNEKDILPDDRRMIPVYNPLDREECFKVYKELRSIKKNLI